MLSPTGARTLTCSACEQVSSDEADDARQPKRSSRDGPLGMR
jgi:hypothetical protein